MSARAQAKVASDNDVLATKYPYVCHAEMNAVMNKNASSLKGAKVYVTLYPCNECAKILIQAGICEVVYFEGKMDKPGKGSGTGVGDESTQKCARGRSTPSALTGADPCEFR